MLLYVCTGLSCFLIQLSDFCHSLFNTVQILFSQKKGLLKWCGQSKSVMSLSHWYLWFYFQSLCRHGPRCVVKVMRAYIVSAKFLWPPMFLTFRCQHCIGWWPDLLLAISCQPSSRLSLLLMNTILLPWLFLSIPSLESRQPTLLVIIGSRSLPQSISNFTQNFRPVWHWIIFKHELLRYIMYKLSLCLFQWT